MSCSVYGNVARRSRTWPGGGRKYSTPIARSAAKAPLQTLVGFVKECALRSRGGVEIGFYARSIDPSSYMNS